MQSNNKQLMLIYALHSGTIGVVSPLVAPLAERIRYRFTILLGLVLLALGYSGAAFLNFGSIWPMVFCLGAVVGSGSALITVATSALSGAFTKHRRLWSVMLTVLPTVGAAVRVPLFRALLERFGPLNALALWAAALFVTATVTVPFLLEPTARENVRAQSTGGDYKLWSTPFVLFLIGIVLITSYVAARELSPKYAESELGMSGTMSAWAASLGFTVTLGALLLLLMATRLVHTDGVMLSSVLVTALSAFCMAWTSDERVFVGMLSLFGASCAVAWALFPAAMAERLEDAKVQMPRAYGLAYSTSALSSACYSVVSGAIIDASGTTRVYFVFAAVTHLGGICAFAASLWLVRRRRVARSESQVPLDTLLKESEVQ